jgi:hypothetical protein
MGNSARGALERKLLRFPPLVDDHRHHRPGMFAEDALGNLLELGRGDSKYLETSAKHCMHRAGRRNPPKKTSARLE